MSTLLKKNIPLTITFLIGVILSIEWFFVSQPFSSAGRVLRDFAVTVAAFALGLGGIDLMLVHGKHIMKRTKDQWYHSAVLIFTMLSFIALGTQQSSTGPQYRWWFASIIDPLSSTMYGSIAFFITSACYRALRVRTKEAAVLLGTAMILLIRNAPIGPAVWGGFPVVASWIMDIVTASGYRAIMLGVAIGLIAQSIRVLVGVERGYLGRE